MLEEGPIGGREIERIGQSADGVGAGSGIDTALEIADGADAQVSVLGQLLLGEGGSRPEFSEESAE